MNVGNKCGAAWRHTAEVATFSNIPTAHNLMRLYMSRDWTMYGIPLRGREFSPLSRRTWGPSTLLEDGNRVSFPRANYPGCGVNHFQLVV